jgi:hypothetical protein
MSFMVHTPVGIKNRELRIRNRESGMVVGIGFGGLQDGGDDAAELFGVCIEAIELGHGEVVGVSEQAQPVGSLARFLVSDRQLGDEVGAGLAANGFFDIGPDACAAPQHLPG